MRAPLFPLSLLLCLPLAAQTSTPPTASNPLPVAPAMPVSAETRAAVIRIIGDTMVDGQAYEYDRELADEIGPRLTGSQNYLKAVAWGVEKFKQLGLTNVHRETLTLDTWEPEVQGTGRIVAPIEHPLHLWSYGWSASTPKKGVEGEVLYLPSMTEEGLKSVGEKARGKILFFDKASFSKKFTMGDFFKVFAGIEKLGPAAVLTPGGPNETESMGAFTFSGALSSYPVAQVGAEDMLLIKRLNDEATKKKTAVRIAFQFSNRTKKAVAVPQVVGEIRGSEMPEEVVLVGGHLDSWNPGTGAQDNGTGSATVVDAAREIRSLGRAPKRTMRFVLFGGEEQGLVGSLAYAKAHRNEMGKIDAVLITDTGGEAAKGWLLMGRSDEKGALAEVKPLLSGLGSDGTSEDATYLFATDHAAFDVLGVPTLVLWTEEEKYFKLHHKASDTFDTVNKATLLQGDATVTATAYAIADSSAPFAPHISPEQVSGMMKAAGQGEDYEFLQKSGLLP